MLQRIKDRVAALSEVSLYSQENRQGVALKGSGNKLRTMVRWSVKGGGWWWESGGLVEELGKLTSFELQN